MKRYVKAILCVCVLSVPLAAAVPVVKTLVGPRDLTAYQAALTDLNTKSSVWETEVGETDSAKAALDAAQAAYDAQVAEEAAARVDLETAQATYTAAYGAVEKEDGSTSP